MRNNYLLLADILKAKRTLFGDSLRSVAGEVGISHTELARIENGNRENFSLLTLVNLCDVLNIDVVKLLMITGYIPFNEEMFDQELLNTFNDFIRILEPDDDYEEEFDEDFEEEYDKDEELEEECICSDCLKKLYSPESHVVVHIIKD